MSGVLAAEWERVDLLCDCLEGVRRGRDLPDHLCRRLREVQAEVQRLRLDQPWRPLVRKYALLPLDQDILSCVLAPDGAPRLGWRFQQMQPGSGAPYPSAAFLRELLVMKPEEAQELHDRVGPGGALARANLLTNQVFDPFASIRPTERARSELLGWTPVSGELEPPGAIRVPPEGSWRDLVLPESSLQGLRELLLWITHREVVERRWGGRAGAGPMALFAGPSGTGKTLAARVLASTLGWPLYRVDLGRLVSKYVGETEKNLSALFEAAHGREAILLFDEADSLFGRRGEIKEARDRYANMEVSHLLARLEQHRGPCILTSNLRHHLDHAFARRFQMVVDFPWPEARARERIWRSHIPPLAPLTDELERMDLGGAVSLSGGQIRNASLHAAFLAAGEGSPLTPAHIARAVRTELVKEGREIRPSSLGGLAQYLPQEDEGCVH